MVYQTNGGTIPINHVIDNREISVVYQSGALLAMGALVIDNREISVVYQ